MRVSELRLEHYRNYSDLQLSFTKNLTIFLGENAQGKTNVLESLYLLALTKSHRTTNEKECIEWEHDVARIKGTVERAAKSRELEVAISTKGRKTKINGLEQAKLSDYVGQLNVILFAPEDLALVKGAPQVRRRFIDIELGQMDRHYLYHLSQYQHALKQRNHYLKKAAETKQFDAVYFEILTDQFVEAGSQVLFARLRFIQQLEKWANHLHQRITHQKETLTIRYQPSIAIDETTSLEGIQTTFKEVLASQERRERQRQTTLAGPHRDDLHFFINGTDVQMYGSQGQQRTTALSVKLAEIDLMHELVGEYPILLLDDVLSELDDERQMHLMEAIEEKVQTFLTATSLEHIQHKMKTKPSIFYVKHGVIEGNREEA